MWFSMLAGHRSTKEGAYIVELAGPPPNLTSVGVALRIERPRWPAAPPSVSMSVSWRRGTLQWDSLKVLGAWIEPLTLSSRRDEVDFPRPKSQDSPKSGNGFRPRRLSYQLCCMQSCDGGDER